MPKKKKEKWSVLVVGAGKGGVAIVEMLSTEKEVDILGVVDKDENAPGLAIAKQKGIRTADNWNEFIKNPLLNEIIDVTGVPDVNKKLLKDKPTDVDLMSGLGAKMMWFLVEKHERMEAILEQEREELSRQTLKNRFNNVLLLLSKMESENLEDSINEIIRKDAKTLGVERVSVWLFDANKEKLICKSSYHLQDDSYGCDEPFFLVSECPIYVASMENDIGIIADDAPNNAHMAEFRESYLEPLSITSMMDFPIRSHGRVVGVLCHEHVGEKRQWSIDEQAFGHSLADLISMVLETNEKKILEESLRRNEAIFRTVADYTYNWEYWIHRNGSFEYISPSCERITGYSVRDFLDNKDLLFEIVHDDDKGIVKKHADAEYYDQNASFLDFRIVTKEGEVRWIEHSCNPVYDDDGKIVGRRVSNRDSTNKQIAEEELAKSRALLLAAFEQSPAGMILADSPDVRIKLANSAALGIRGGAEVPLLNIPVDLHPQNWQIFYPDGTRCLPEDLPLSRAILNGEETRNRELIIRKGSGEDRWVSVNAAPVKNEEGDIVAGVAVFPDITDQKEHEQKIVQLNSVLKAVRDVEQLIIQEKDVSKLLEGACEILVEARRYKSSWIMLFDESGNIAEAVNSGIGDEFLKMRGNIEAGKIVYCAEKALKTSDVIYIDPERKLCGECPLEETCSAVGRMAVGLRYKDKIYGLLCVSVSEELGIIQDEEEKLLKELASDIGYALYSIGLEIMGEKARKALIESEDKYRNLVERANDGICIIQDEEVLYLNDQLARIVNYNISEVLNTKHYKYVAEDELAKNVDVYERFMSGQIDRKRFETKLKKKDGSTVDVELNISDIIHRGKRAMLALVSDITERKEMEGRLRQSEEKYRMLIETAGDAIFIFSGKDGSALEVNNKGEELLGKPCEEIVNKRFDELFPKEYFPGGERYFSMAIRGEAPFKIALIPNEKGYQVPVQISSSVFELRDEKYLISILRDISGLKSIMDTLRKDKFDLEKILSEKTEKLSWAMKELEDAKRISDISLLAATIAHELRNPLGVIRTAAFNIRRKERNEAIQRHIDSIDKKILESDQIIENLLNFSRIKMPNYEKVSLFDFVNGIVEQASIKYKNQAVRIETDYKCGNGGVIELDPVQISEVAYNLIENAVHSFDGRAGVVKISVEYSPKSDAYIFEFADNGSGIDKSDLSKLFEPFFTTKARGIGIGLTVCNQIVSLHSGKIKFSSLKGEGTTVSITLPAKRKFKA